MTDHVITRALLEAGGIDAMVARSGSGMRLLTEAQRAESLHQTLAARLPGEPVWLFGYGSLIWNPAIHFEERRPATIKAGTALSAWPPAPGGHGESGLVLGLDEGGQCSGVAFRIADAIVETELTLLWRREMLAGSYVPRWVDVADTAGLRFGTAIAFTVNRKTEQYAGELAKQAVIDRLATAAGELGTAADYLFRTCAGLHAEGIPDPELDHLAQTVAAAQTKVARDKP